MASPAARVGDRAIHDAPHCHMQHPVGLTTQAIPHPPMPLAIIGGCNTVLIAGQPAARVNDSTQPCVLGGCNPSGPGRISRGSMTVLIGNLPAARVGDMVSFPGCVAPIPSPTGKVMPPGCVTVLIGG
jgi:uncharacterized Zn-binding protein involved in type VI secretion